MFRVEKTNARIPSDGVIAALTVLDGVNRVQGLELGVAGRLTRNWQVSVGYSYLESKIEKTTVAADLGKELPGTPPHNLTVWTTYDVTSAWTIGRGAFYQARAWTNTANTNFVPEYVRLDAMASYKVTSNATLQLNLYNLTDVLYYSQYYAGHAVPAAGRSASLSLKMRW